MYLLQRLSVAELPVGGVRELACPRGEGSLVYSHFVGGDLWLIWITGGLLEHVLDWTQATVTATPDVGWGGP